MPFIRTRRHVVYRLEPGQSFKDTPLPAGFTVKDFEPSDVARFADDRALQKTFRDFLKKGVIGVLVLRDEAWASYAWMTHPPTSGRPWQMPGCVDAMDVMWCFSAHTKDEYRGHGLVKFMHAWRIKRAFDPASGGPRTIYVDTAPGNVPARKGMLSAGFKPCGLMHCVHFTLRYVGGRTFGRWHQDEVHPPIPEGRHD